MSRNPQLKPGAHSKTHPFSAPHQHLTQMQSTRFTHCRFDFARRFLSHDGQQGETFTEQTLRTDTTKNYKTSMLLNKYKSNISQL